MQIIEWIASYGGWSWVVAGVVLLALELVVPGGIFLWLGISGVITGLAALFWVIGWPIQFLVFGLLSLVTIFGWLRYWKGRVQPTDRPFLNDRAGKLVGREIVLNEPIRDGFGRLPIGDTQWRISGPDLSAGQKVRIVGYDGAVLKVEAA
jgi:membrane protein implicated in regulation of membrane protease activity